jgi:putative Holliday junction resolvase
MKGRILAVDYGSKRTGLAVTDPLEIIVSPLDTVPTESLIQYFENYFSAEKVYKIVIGDPSDGLPEDHPNLKAIKKLVQSIKEKWPNLDIVHHDEAFTSEKAKEIIFKSGVKKMKRRNKALIDKISAVLILQDYLGHI